MGVGETLRYWMRRLTWCFLFIHIRQKRSSQAANVIPWFLPLGALAAEWVIGRDQEKL